MTSSIWIDVKIDFNKCSQDRVTSEFSGIMVFIMVFWPVFFFYFMTEERRLQGLKM